MEAARQKIVVADAREYLAAAALLMNGITPSSRGKAMKNSGSTSSSSQGPFVSAPRRHRTSCSPSWQSSIHEAT